MSKNIEKQYLKLLKDILDNGVEKKDRTGTGTISVFGRQIRHKMSEGFPALTTKKLAFKTMTTELLWFLRGDTNIKYLVDNNCHIWDGDCYRKYEILMIGNNPDRILNKEEFINKIKTDDEFAQHWGELGPIYGAQWRKWDGIDQIGELIHNLKTNPDSRRLMVSAWNVNYLDEMTLPPCHYGFQVYTRELSYNEKVHEARKRFGFELEDGTRTFDINSRESIEFITSTQRAISLMWNQRSVDTFLGLPFNIASYGLLLEIIAKEVNMIPDELIGNLGDTHLYSNHLEQAREQITREPYPLPQLEIAGGKVKWKEGDCLPYYSPGHFKLVNYQSHPAIKAPLSN